MSKNQFIEQVIQEQEYILNRFKFVQSHFPDAQVQQNYIPARFKSKSVNLQYTDIEFAISTSEIWVIPYHKLIFNYNNKEETIMVHAIPSKSKLAYIDHEWVGESNARTLERVIRFSKLAFNLKTSKFNDHMMNECRTNILQFIKNNPESKLDDSNLEERLKRLIIFT